MRTSDFQIWLSQPVYVNHVTQMPRRRILPVFVDELMDMLRAKGYIMCEEWRSGHLIVAQWLYRIHQNRDKLVYPRPYHRAWPEDYAEFQHVLDSEVIGEFMESWGLCEDFDPDTRLGQRVLHELQLLLYPYLDLEESRNGQIVADALSESDSESEDGRRARPAVRKVDNYIADAQEGYHGGNWSKV